MDSSSSSPPDPPPTDNAARTESDYGEIFSRYARRVTGYLVRKGLSPAAAEALTEVAMLTAWQRFTRKGRPPPLFDTWIFCVARDQRAVLLHRTQRPEPDPDDPCWVADDSKPSSAPRPLETTHMRLRNALDSLPEVQRETLKHLYFQGQSTTAIARALGSREDEVREHIRDALHTLRIRSREDNGKP